MYVNIFPRGDYPLESNVSLQINIMCGEVCFFVSINKLLLISNLT